jgi:hypothetical protein
MKTIVYSAVDVENIPFKFDTYVDAKTTGLLDLSLESWFDNDNFVIYHSFFSYSSEINYRKFLANFIKKNIDGVIEIVVAATHQSMPLLLRSLRAIGLDNIVQVTRHDANIHIKFSRNEGLYNQAASSQIMTALPSAELPDFLADLKYAIQNRKPLSLVRVGHCEVKFLSYGYMYGDTDLKQTYQIQWGVDSVTKDFFDFVRAGVLNSINVSKYLGFNLVTDIGSGNLRIYENSVYRSLSDFSMIKHYNKRVSPNIHYNIGTSNVFISLLHNAEKIVLITSRPALLDRFCQLYGGDKVDLIQLPGEFRVDGKYDFNERAERFTQIDSIINEIAKPGVVFLIGGGVAGKGFCATVYNGGAIAIDVGSVFDAWAGVDSRGDGFNQTIKNFLIEHN